MRRSFLTVFVVILTLFSTGALSYEQKTDVQANVALIQGLRLFMQSARQVLETQVDLSWNYRQQVNLLAGKLAEIDNKLEQVQESSLDKAFALDRDQPASLAGLDNETRISILGSRALLGYKAQLLQIELARLTQGNDNKLDAFESSIAKAEDLSDQVMKLRFVIRQKMEQQNLIPSSQIVQENFTNPEGRKPHGPKRYSGQNIAEEARTVPPMLVQLAAAGAGEPKVGPARTPGTDSEAKYAVSDLKRKLDEVAKQTKALQQLVSEIVQKTEAIKKQERQTDSKLTDMRQLTKNWEGKKIPVNEEFVSLEKKLSVDIATYQEALKEVDMLKQYLTSMFNGILTPESGTQK